MRYVRQAGTDPSFLLKALGEASGEFRNALYGIPRRALTLPGEGQDDDWSLLALAVHMRDVEIGIHRQLEAIVNCRRGEPEIPHVDIDNIPFLEDVIDEDEDETLEEFHHARRQTAYALWDISERDWERAGVDPYRGRMTILEIVRELYQHDLQHLWQARRMFDALGIRQR